MLEDWLNKRTNSREQPLTRINHTILISEGSGTCNSDVRIETAAGCLNIVEALCQRHLILMNISTVGQHLDAYACRELGGQALLSELATSDSLTRLTKQQRE